MWFHALRLMLSATYWVPAVLNSTSICSSPVPGGFQLNRLTRPSRTGPTLPYQNPSSPAPSQIASEA